MRNVICINELNEVMNCKKSEKKNLVPGMGATMFVGSDRYAMIVREVITPKKIKVSHVADAHMNRFVKDENGVMMLPEELLNDYNKFGNYYDTTVYTLRKNGRWMPAGHGMWETCSIHIGSAENYLDPSF